MKQQPLATETGQPTYLEVLAYLGATRHYGAWKATDELADLCHVEAGKFILDVGCGTGKSSSAFAKKRGCRVVGVDLSPRMIEWARETARREGVLDRVEFKTADAQQLPFEDATFDAVICESVLALVADKARALAEFLRVCKPGGYVGVNETTWLTSPVPAEVEASLDTAGFGSGKIVPLNDWRALLDASGLTDVTMKTYRMSARGNVIDRLQWFGIRGMVRNVIQMRAFAKASPSNRAALNQYFALSRSVPKNLYDFFGYAIFAGRKAG
jgi:arsenite methyltransferase